MPTPSLIEVEQADAPDRLRMRVIWSDDASLLRKDYTSLGTFKIGNINIFFGYSATDGSCDLYGIGEGAMPFSKLAARPHLGTAWDSIYPFVLGNRQHLMCYRKDSGLFGFFELCSDLSVSRPYHWSHPRDPGLSVGFTTVRPVVCIGQVYFFGYNIVTGNVVLYSLGMTATSSGGVPPLAGHHLWQRCWAQGWTRFAFFTFGGTNFFLKTNTWRPNVNIDQIRDNPADGTVEVATQMDLKDAQTLDICEAFTMRFAEPHFAAYKSTGETVLYRVHADCQGWTAVAADSTVGGASKIVPVAILDSTDLLFY